MITPKFESTIKNGRYLILDANKFNRYIKRFRDGVRLETIVRRWEKTDSDPLRKYYFKVVAGMISEHTGHSKDAVHEAMKIKFASYEEYGLLFIESVFSKQSKMKISRKQEFIQDVRTWANDFFDLAIPEPEGRYVIE